MKLLAQGYQPLAPGAESLGLGGGNGVPSIANLVNTMFDNILAVLGILAVLMIVIGGIQYMGSESVFGKDSGKKRIGAALGGIILALSAWVILKLINPQLLEFNVPNLKNNLDSGGGIAVEGTTNQPPVTGTDGAGNQNGEQTGNDTVTSGNYGESQKLSQNEQTIRNTLLATGISVKQSNTTVEGLRESTYLGLLQLKEESGQGFYLTGGTEPGHAGGTYSHANGYKVDIGLGASIDKNKGVHDYILSTYFNNQLPANNSASDKVLKSGQRANFRYEANPPHWDITFYPTQQAN